MPGNEALETKLRDLIAAAGCEAGVSVLHVERDERTAIDGDRRFPACSVFKVPVLVEAFRQASIGEFSMLNRWALEEDDKSVGSGVLQTLDARLAPTVHDLLTLMIIISDNTAADILTRRLGPERITATMQTLGLRNTWVTVTCRDMIASAFGPGDTRMLPAERSRIIKEHPPRPDSATYGDGRDNDVTTADDMVDLFSFIQTGRNMDRVGLGLDDCVRMLRIVHRQQLNDRLPRYLPPTLLLAHKTGSISGAYEVHNDAGILELPDGNHVAMAVFTRAPSPGLTGDPRALTQLRRLLDDLIAEVGLAAFEHYVPADG